MKKVISILLVVAMVAAVFTVSFNALSVTSESVPTVADAIAAYEEESGETVEVKKVYFQMPNGKTGAAADDDVKITKEVVNEETGEVSYEEEVVMHAGDKAPSWFNDFNKVDGVSYGGVYWWGGTAACDTWVGYRLMLEDATQNIYYALIPDDVTVAIFNNGVDGGTDTSEPIYYQAAQTVDMNVEGAYEGDYDTLPEGSPSQDWFDDCIYIIDPNQVEINAFSGKQTCGGNWYVYYGNGCYGEYPETSDNFVSAEENCVNPDHFNEEGVHVGYQPSEDPTEAPTEAPTAAPTEAPTAAPTEAPTAAPTEAPTAAPTEAPTAAPTEAPTAAPTEAPTEPKTVTGILGDVNADGEVDILDVLIIQRIEAGIYGPDDSEAAVIGMTMADVDGDGEVTVLDVTFIQRYLVGIDDAYKIGTKVTKEPIKFQAVPSIID